MNRHHPYGGGGYEGGRRGGGGGGSPMAPGPDRSRGRFNDRGGGPSRGRGRGRGGYSGFNGGYSQDSNHESATPDSYGQWGSSQDSYYSGQNSGSQNGGYGNENDSYNASYDDGYDQNFGGYEDGGANRGRGGRRGGAPRRERDDKVHDNLIEERIMRERPCRTLFIRNIKYETDSDDVRRKFEEHGEIKTFFDLIANRGMVFVTYYDLRAAERARERLQDTQISGRPIDVHYSLPRADEQNAKDPKDRNQGTLLFTLRGSQSGQPLEESELRRRCQLSGDIKVTKAGLNPHNERIVEFYDVRACDDAYERMNHQNFQDGILDVIYSSDISEVPLPGPIPARHPDSGVDDQGYGARDFNEQPSRGRRGGRGGRGRGGPPREDWDRRDDWDRDRDRGGFRDDYGRGRGRGRGGGDRFENRGGGGGGGAFGPHSGAPGNYGPPAMPHQQNLPSVYGAPIAGLPDVAPVADDRLEQARKVQQLLAALKQPQGQGVSPGAGSAPPGATAPNQVTPSGPPVGQYYPTPPPAMSQPVPLPYPGANAPPMPPNMYGVPPPGPPSSQATSTPANLQGLPPNIMAMLQQATQQPHGSAPSMPPPYAMPPFPPTGVPAPGSAPPPTGQSSYLMSYLQNQTVAKGP